MSASELDDAELGALGDDIRQHYNGLVQGAAVLPLLRRIVYTARRQYADESVPMGSPAPAPAPAPADDELKPLPPSTINDVWSAGYKSTGGFSAVLPQFRFSDAIMSKMIRSNKVGECWLPTVGEGLAYREPSSTKMITTLLKSATSDTQLQLVQGGQSVEREDHVSIPPDYDAIVGHRAAAMVAAFSTDDASTAFMASTTFTTLELHALQTTNTKKYMIMPYFAKMLADALGTASRHGYSPAGLLSIDRRVISAILERVATMPIDGNKAIEYVCHSRTNLFAPDVSTSVVGLAQLGGGQTGAASSVAGSSVSGFSAQSYGDERAKLNQMQRERDEARHAVKIARGGGYTGKGGGRKPFYGGRGGGGGQYSSGGSSNGGGGQTAFGGHTKVLGGGNNRGPQICNAFNTASGCSRTPCNFRHVCNVHANGKPCENPSHCALHH